jgi:hypothetical protein
MDQRPAVRDDPVNRRRLLRSRARLVALRDAPRVAGALDNLRIALAKQAERARKAEAYDVEEPLVEAARLVGRALGEIDKAVAAEKTRGLAKSQEGNGARGQAQPDRPYALGRAGIDA